VTAKTSNLDLDEVLVDCLMFLELAEGPVAAAAFPVW
jgi:hypothetical protein